MAAPSPPSTVVTASATTAVSSDATREGLAGASLSLLVSMEHDIATGHTNINNDAPGDKPRTNGPKQPRQRTSRPACHFYDPGLPTSNTHTSTRTQERVRENTKGCEIGDWTQHALPMRRSLYHNTKTSTHTQQHIIVPTRPVVWGSHAPPEPGVSAQHWFRP